MTTFTSDDREEAYKKILEEAPNQPGYEDAVPIAEQVNASPPHIVDSGASVMIKDLTDFEIRGVMALDECWVGEDCSMPNMIAFARAILRKAQEK